MDMNEMIPRPPSWISIRITIFPTMLHAANVSTTTRPVTQTEVVAVKRAVTRSFPWPSAEDIGSISNKVPKRITKRKLAGMIFAGDTLNLRSLYSCLP